ncbi:GNAT family N-acetyltransferase [Leifsonia sp. LS-T14]|uniref:GNAT family N-acetyltransferase n=1 Tax=unclassified Leifsonia TaxID=2663824 RepID=UPI0035A6F1BE
MEVSLRPLDARANDHDALVAFLTGNTFPFHVVARPTADQVETAIEAGSYGDDDHASFWISAEAGERVGLLRLHDLADPTPLLDLRIADSLRGRGIGTSALRAATELVFTSMPAVVRFEGQTREDNIPMRRTFLRCGWVKEAHYREAWPTADGRKLASVAYAILRRDWALGTTTPVPWNDEPAGGQGGRF